MCTLIHYIRYLMGLQAPPRPSEESTLEAQPNPPRLDEKQRLYLGRPVPLEASHDPEEAKVFHASLAEEFSVVPANDGTSVLVFSDYFLSESAEDKSVVYDDWEMTVRRDPRDHPKRLADTVRIYEHLFHERQPHPRIVRYLGPTPSGFRLERLPISSIQPSTHMECDAVLALHQRWALQMLSALQWIHERGVTLQEGAIQQEALWLRTDLSIAVACFVTAGCVELDITTEYWPSYNFENPWSAQMQRRCEPPYTWEDTGLAKGDIVDWATWVYGLMMGKEADPLSHDLDISGREDSGRHLQRSHAAERGEFDDWPRLPKEQFGEVLIRAWSGDYESAQEALEDCRRTLEECGRSLTDGKLDEIDGFYWESLFKVGRGQLGGDELQIKLPAGPRTETQSASKSTAPCPV